MSLGPLLTNLSPGAGLDLLVDVSFHAQPPVRLQEPFLGLVDAIMPESGVPWASWIVSFLIE